MAYFIKLRQGGIEGPVHDRKGPFVSEELATLAAQPLAEQAPDGYFVTVERDGKRKLNPKKRVTKRKVAKKRNPRPTISSALIRMQERRPVHSRSAVTNAIVAEAKQWLKKGRPVKVTAAQVKLIKKAQKEEQERRAILAELKKLEAKANPKKRQKAKNPRPTIAAAKKRLAAGKKIAARSRVTKAIVKEAGRLLAKEARMKGVRKGTGLPGFHASDLFPKKKKAVKKKKNPAIMATARKALPYAKKAVSKLTPHAKRAAANALEKAVKQLRANRRKKVK